MIASHPSEAHTSKTRASTIVEALLMYHACARQPLRRKWPGARSSLITGQSIQ